MALKLSILFLIAILLVVFSQDLRKRTIHIVLPIVIFLFGLFINYLSQDLSFEVIAYNMVFVVINLLGLFIYFSLKSKKFINPIDTHIGLGDIVFLFALTPLFQLKGFILFFILGLLFSLLTHIVLMFFKQTKTIPLAGYISLFLILNLTTKYFFKINTLF